MITTTGSFSRRASQLHECNNETMTRSATETSGRRGLSVVSQTGNAESLGRGGWTWSSSLVFPLAFILTSEEWSHWPYVTLQNKTMIVFFERAEMRVSYSICDKEHRPYLLCTERLWMNHHHNDWSFFLPTDVSVTTRDFPTVTGIHLFNKKIHF